MSDKPALPQGQFTAYCDGWLLGRAGNPTLPKTPYHNDALNRLRHQGWSDAMAGLERQYTVEPNA